MTRSAEGVVRRIAPGRVLVDLGEERIEAHVRGLLKGGPRRAAHVVAVGDRVRLKVGGPEGATLEAVLPRRNRVSRADPGDARVELVMAANLDQLAVLLSFDQPRFNPRILDRLLILGEGSGLPCLIFLNKMDLRPSSQAAPDPLEVYRSLGYRTFAISALTGEGCEKLPEALAGRITLLAGPSGAGKTSLLNRLWPALRLRTSPISRATSKGVHTTTRVDWIPLPDGGAVLDAPGIRSIHPWGLSAETLASHFPEFRNLPGCRFADCLHREEPGCAVRNALSEGLLYRDRYESYLRILASC